MHFKLQDQRKQGFTLVDCLVALAIMGLVFDGLIQGYIFLNRSAELTGRSLAAQALAEQQIEQGRSAIWDPSTTPVKNELTSLNAINWTCINTNTGTWTGYVVYTLGLPITGTNVIYATNFITVSTVNVSVNPPVTVQMMDVDTVWPYTPQFGKARLYTNSAATLFAPDNAQVQ